MTDNDPFHPNTLGVPGRIVTLKDETPGAKLRAEGYDMELPPSAGAAFSQLDPLFLAKLQMWPDLYAQIHPDKAASLSLEDGDRVIVETSHG